MDDVSCYPKGKPWEFSLMVNLNNDGRVDVRMESIQRMELTISKTSMVVFSRLSQTFSSAIQAQLPSRDENVIILKNLLAFNLVLYLKASGVREKGMSKKIESICVPANGEIQLTSLDEKVSQLLIGIQANETEMTRKIDLRGNGKKCFEIPSTKSYPSGHSWKWICNVESIDAYSKRVSFQSCAQIINNMSVSMQVFSCDSEKNGMF
jgi:hypothetical protein